MAESLVGQTWGGCRVVRELGRGGMSIIYLAEQESIGREVALKVMYPAFLEDTTFMLRFTREVKTTADLQHPHIIPIYNYGEQAGRPYIIMAYMPGGSLYDLIDLGPLPLDVATRIITQVATALDFAHGYGVIHRDIKPGNILLDAQQNAFLTDFGIAKLVAETYQITRDELVGTFSYLAPEMISDNNPITPATDVYSLGVTLFQMLTGQLPFTADTSVKMMWKHVNEPAPLLVPLRPDLPPDLDAVLQKALAKAPAARYQGGSQLAEDLASVAAGENPAHAEHDPPPTQILPSSPAPRLEDAIRRVIDQVVKIRRPDGGSGAGIYLPGDQVLTVLHVVDGAEGIFVSFRTGEQLEADMLAADPSLDLALLGLRSSPTSLSADQLDGLSFAPAELEPGEPLAAIGHPLGLDWAVTGGHYNALRMPGSASLLDLGITLDAPLAQVDVTINAGNSGGPIIDSLGQLVGVAISIVNPAIANNIGFAIEGQTAWQFVQRMRETAPERPDRLLPYNCGHHHAPDQAYCPLTGKPVTLRAPVGIPTVEGVRYSCNHVHPIGLRYCPLIGKPAHALEEPVTGRASAADMPDTPTDTTCTNCGQVYATRLGYCPQCGKPVRD